MKAWMNRGVWFGLFALCGGVTCFFIIQFSLKTISYSKLSDTHQAVVEAYSLKEIKDNKWAIEASYTYSVKGDVYHNKYLFTDPLFLNHFAAKQHVDKYWKDKVWQVWYNGDNPSESSLQKMFPFRLLFKLGLSIALCFYFIWLKQYVFKMSI